MRTFVLTLIATISIANVMPAQADTGCEGRVLNASIGMSLNDLTVKLGEEHDTLNGRVGGLWLRSRIEESADRTRIRGWYGNGSIDLTIQKKSETETRISGRIGSAEPVSLRATVNDRGEATLSGLTSSGSASLVFYADGMLNGRVNQRQVRLTLDQNRDSGEVLALRGRVEMDFAEVTVARCMDERGWLNGMTVSQFLAALVVIMN